MLINNIFSSDVHLMKLLQVYISIKLICKRDTRSDWNHINVKYFFEMNLKCY